MIGKGKIMLDIENLTKADIEYYTDANITDFDKYTDVVKKLVEYVKSERFLNEGYSEEDYISLCNNYSYDINEKNIIHKMSDFDDYCSYESFSYSDVIERTQNSHFDLNDDYFIDNGMDFFSDDSILFFKADYIDLNDVLIQIICNPVPFACEYPSPYQSKTLNRIKQEISELIIDE